MAANVLKLVGFINLTKGNFNLFLFFFNFRKQEV
jgi:hypothetical protein